MLKRDYISINRKAYDRLADKYNQRWDDIIGHQPKVLQPLADLLSKTFTTNIQVLDVGCGVGLDSHVLSKFFDFELQGIDISEKMLSYAKKNSPLATFINANFLNFATTNKFSGILMDSFIHQFPQKDVGKVIRKAKSLLYPRGMILACTNEIGVSIEGYYTKEDYSPKVKRFRKFWTKNELISAFEKEGLKLKKYYTDLQPKFYKNWSNFIFQLT